VSAAIALRHQLRKGLSESLVLFVPEHILGPLVPEDYVAKMIDRDNCIIGRFGDVAKLLF
jgi:hypothetical protein